jgi:ABC-type uncharacterized transport system permease subunit
MNEKMKRKFEIYIFVGLLIGAIFGIFLGTGNENPIPGIGGGALASMFIGLFVAAAVQQNQNNNDKQKM